MTERKNIVKALALLLVTVITVTMLPVNRLRVQAGSDICVCNHSYSEHSSTSPQPCNHSGCNCAAFSPASPSGGGTTPGGSTTPSTSSSTVAVKVSEEDKERAAEEIARAELEEASRVKHAAQRTREEEAAQEKAARAAEAQKALDEAEKFSKQNSQLSTGGTVIKTTVDGAYTAKSVEGTAVTTSQEQLKENFNLKEGESLRAVTWDTTAKNSPDAMRSLEQAAKGIGGELGPAITVTIKKTSSGANPALKTITKALLQDYKGIGHAVGAVNTDDWADYLSDKPDDQSFLAKYNEAMKETLNLDPNSENYANEVKAVFEKYGLGGPDEALSRLEDIRNEVDEFTKARGSAEMTVGVPQNFQSENSTFSVVKVLPGGKTEVLPDKDTIPGIVSFDVTEGEATYALVKKTNDTAAPTYEIKEKDYNKGSTVLGKAGLGLAKYMYDSVNEVATPEEKSLIDNMQKANDEYSALDTSGMNSAEVEDARDAIFQKYGFEDSSDAAEKVGDIMEKYNII